MREVELPFGIFSIENEQSGRGWVVSIYFQPAPFWLRNIISGEC